MQLRLAYSTARRANTPRPLVPGVTEEIPQETHIVSEMWGSRAPEIELGGRGRMPSSPQKKVGGGAVVG